MIVVVYIHFCSHVGSICVLSLGIYVVAAIAGSNASFAGILSGVVFLNLLATALFIVLAAVIALPVALLPEETASALLVCAGHVWAGLTMFYYVVFLDGVFELGCVLAAGLGVLAGLVANSVDTLILYALGVA